MNPYLPSTPEERRAMAQAVGVASAEELLDQVPHAVRWTDAPAPGTAVDILGCALSEMELVIEARQRAAQNSPLGQCVSFLGAGIYRHFIPSSVPHLALRSEFLTAYTPYQPEASQGLLQAIFEFQTLIARLTDMEVANAGLYDSATALAEAVMMGMSLRPKARRVLLSAAIHPQYREVVKAHLAGHDDEIVEVPSEQGLVNPVTWLQALGESGSTAIAAFQSPNFFGCLENGGELVAAAHEAGAVAVTVFNPIALGILATPGQWGADIAVGEGQPLGMAPGAGGETLGLFATRKEHLWKVPGRLVGLTRDRLRRRAYVLTLQSREQHIRRARATSNICTNHSLYALMASVYLATLGPEGLGECATLCARRSAQARQRLGSLPGCSLAFPQALHFHEFVLRTGRPSALLARAIEESEGILPGLPLGQYDAALDDALLICTTELTTEADIDRLARAIESARISSQPA